MWSVQSNGLYSAFNAKQRVGFLVDDHEEETKSNLFKAMTTGICFSVYITKPDDVVALHQVQSCVEAACGRTTPQLSRAQFRFVCESGLAWQPESFVEQVTKVVEHLRIDALDALVLNGQHVFDSNDSLLQRKQKLLLFWPKCMELHQRALVRAIGVANFTMQEMEILFNNSPSQLPTIASFKLAPHVTQVTKKVDDGQDELHKGVDNDSISTRTNNSESQSRPTATIKSPMMTPPTQDTPLLDMVSFCRSRQMEMVVKYPFRLDNLPVEHQSAWKRTCQDIAQQFAKQSVEFAFVNEADNTLFHVDKRTLQQITPSSEDEPNQPLFLTELLLGMRFLLQLGLLVVPITEANEEPIEVQDVQQLFGHLTHSLTTALPQSSPHKLYAIVLNPSQMDRIRHNLPLFIASVN